jgi:hypothetical protein
MIWISASSLLASDFWKGINKKMAYKYNKNKINDKSSYIQTFQILKEHSEIRSQILE